MDTNDVNEAPKSMIEWWKAYKVSSGCKQLASIALRALKQMKGGCDVERSFVYYSDMMRSNEASSMAAVTMETRVMSVWNKESLAKRIFGVNNL